MHCHARHLHFQHLRATAVLDFCFKAPRKDVCQVAESMTSQIHGFGLGALSLPNVGHASLWRITRIAKAHWWLGMQGRGKKDAKQVAAAALLEELLKTVDMSEVCSQANPSSSCPSGCAWAAVHDVLMVIEPGFSLSCKQVEPGKHDQACTAQCHRHQ